MKLLELLVRELGSKIETSKALGISRSTLSNWMNSESRHPSNSSTRRVLELARKVNSEEACKVLSDELDAFYESLISFVHGGANSQNPLKSSSFDLPWSE